ncbi:MAG: ABC transporter permease subunit [Ruminococcaceae bacterium]|nr:ABC transporter permease subunit [Oscillospiraceae bacterium]
MAILKKILKYTVVIAFWIAVWQIASMKVDMELLLPSPRATVERLFELAKTREFYDIILQSVRRILIGTIQATLLGVALAIVTAKIGFLHDLISPFMTVVKAVPVASFIVLLLLWMGRDVLPSVISALIVLPIVWTNMETGIRQTDKNLIELSKVYKMGFFKRIWHIYMPSALPYFTSSLSSSLGLAWKAGIAAEVLALPAIAIGKQISDSKLYLETKDLFAWTLAVIIISLIIEKLFVFLIKKATSKKIRIGGSV